MSDKESPTAGTSNFLQWDPDQKNINTDAEYLASTMRKNGASAEIYPSMLHNKAMYQVTTMVTALAEAFASKGLSMQDSSLSALTTNLSSIATTAATNKFTADQVLLGDGILWRLKDTSTGGIEWGIRSRSGNLEVCYNTGPVDSPTWTVVLSIPTSFKPATVPTGTVLMHAASVVPGGFLECDGAIYAQSTYPELFDVIGRTYTPVNIAATSFLVPDLRGAFVRGWNHGAGRDPNAATRTGANTSVSGDMVGTSQQDEIRSHTHIIQCYYVAGEPDGYPGGDSSSRPYSAKHPCDASGGTETRPYNKYLMYIIKT